MADVSVLEVFLHDRPIGTLTLLQGDRSIFAFNQDYIDEPSRPSCPKARCATTSPSGPE
jgi:serine/threonine-protein kinase HipA